jgi:hypothetical protein
MKPYDVLLASHVSEASNFYISRTSIDKSDEKLKQIGPKSYTKHTTKLKTSQDIKWSFKDIVATKENCRR